jgi:hypothetical protein
MGAYPYPDAKVGDEVQIAVMVDIVLLKLAVVTSEVGAISTTSEFTFVVE